ncbi:MAG TPA: SDR family NAD(P)-dependent oxidoreductase [Actinophytocola sp.]|nr:SDR family NAD(P)-dependent oxidoreductase [Actinophytocola sp.]
METSDKVWFVTGASRGFGRIWTEAALRRGDLVAATARDPRTLDDLVTTHGDALLPLRLDVTDRDAVFEAVRRTADRFGRLDVVVNNAGYGHFGAVEELTEAEIRAQMETNFFGALWVLQAALPIMREQGSGHLVNVTSEGGVRAYPGIGAYHASKWALEGLSESLVKEVRNLGIRVTNVEPGPYGTGWLDVGSRQSTPIAAYDRLRADADAFETGDPAATAPALFAVVDAEEPPLRVFFGRSFEPVREEHMARIAEWERWQGVALSAFGPVAAAR